MSTIRNMEEYLAAKKVYQEMNKEIKRIERNKKVNEYYYAKVRNIKDKSDEEPSYYMKNKDKYKNTVKFRKEVNRLSEMAILFIIKPKLEKKP